MDPSIFLGKLLDLFDQPTYRLVSSIHKRAPTLAFCDIQDSEDTESIRDNANGWDSVS